MADKISLALRSEKTSTYYVSPIPKKNLKAEYIRSCKRETGGQQN